MVRTWKLKNWKRGSALVFSLIILSLLLVSALSVAIVSVTEKKSAIATERSGVAFQIADSGMERTLQKIYKGIPPPVSLNDLASKLGSSCNSGDGSISYAATQGTVKILFYQGILGDTLYTDCAASDWRSQVVKIKSISTYASTTRAVEIGLTPPPSGLVTNGAFDSNTVGWTDNSGDPSSISWSSNNGGSLDLDGVANFARADQTLSTSSGSTYTVKITVNATTGPMDVRVGTSLGGTDLLSKTVSLAGSYTYSFTASGTTSYIEIFTGWTANVDDISVVSP